MAQESENTGRSARTALLAKLLPATRAAAAAAQGLVRGLGSLALLSGLAAVWLVYALIKSLDLAYLAAGVIGILLLLPALMLGVLCFALRELIAVPPRLQVVVAKLKGGAQSFQTAMHDPAAALPKSKWAALKEFARVALELRSFGGEVAEVFVVLRSAALIANPAFALIALVCAFEGVLLIVVALVVALTMAF